MRTSGDFVNDMLKNGRTWTDILSVGSVIRNGHWKEDIELELLERKLMPPDKLERTKQRSEIIKKQKAKQDDDERLALESRRQKAGRGAKESSDLQG